MQAFAHAGHYPQTDSVVNRIRIPRLLPSSVDVLSPTWMPRRRRDNRPFGLQQWTVPEGVEPDSLAAVLARNVWTLMQQSGDLQSQNRTREKAGVGQATISRILACETGTRLRSIEAVAKAFGVMPWVLMHPNPALAQSEAAFYAKLRDLPRPPVERPPT